jgi:ABC-2 type transport system permease protein
MSTGSDALHTELPAMKTKADSGVASGAAAFCLAAATLWQRELVRFFRQPSRVIGGLGSPLLFWVLIGSGLGRSFRPAEVVTAAGASHYLHYFFAGTFLLILLFTAIFSSFSLIQDRKEGFLQGVLVAPVSRGAIVLGKILGGTTLAVVQGLLFFMLAPLAEIHVSAATGFYLTASAFLIAFALTGFGFMLAWPMDSIQGFHSIMSLVLLPMWILSGALFPASGAEGWVKAVMFANPLTYCLNLLRKSLVPDSTTVPGLGLSLAVTCGFAAVTFTISWVLACRRTNKPL